MKGRPRSDFLTGIGGAGAVREYASRGVTLAKNSQGNAASGYTGDEGRLRDRSMAEMSTPDVAHEFVHFVMVFARAAH